MGRKLDLAGLWKNDHGPEAKPWRKAVGSPSVEWIGGDGIISFNLNR